MENDLKRLMAMKQEEYSELTSAQKNKRLSLKFVNSWRQDQTVSLGGYIEYCNEDKELSIVLSLFIFEVYFNLSR